MQTLTVKQDFGLREIYEPHNTYVMSGALAWELEAIANSRRPGSVEIDVIPFESRFKEFKASELLGRPPAGTLIAPGVDGAEQEVLEPGKPPKFLFWRYGGGGDVLMMSPAFRLLKKLFPGCHITFACNKNYWSLLEGNPDVDILRAYPINIKWLEEADYHQHFEGVIEDNTFAKRMHGVDVFLQRFGFQDVPLEEKQVWMAVSKEAIERTDKLFKDHYFEKRHFVVGIQWKVDAPIRQYPPSWIVEVAQTLVREHGVKIVWLGGPSQADAIQSFAIKRAGLAEHAINQMGFPECWSWQDTAATISKCDLVISGDSASLHVAGAMKKVDKETVEASLYDFNHTTPMIGIYGPFLSDQRISRYPNALGLDPDVGCAGCNQHGYSPCSLANPLSRVSPCFYKLPPAVLLEHVRSMIALINRDMPKRFDVEPKDVRGLDLWTSELGRYTEKVLAPQIMGCTLGDHVYPESILPQR